MRLKRFGLLIVALGRRKRPMTEKRSGDPDVLWIGDGERRRGVRKKMGVDGGTSAAMVFTLDSVVPPVAINLSKGKQRR